MYFLLFRDSLPYHYDELMVINEELINGYNIRLQNYNEKVDTMKNINTVIQKASRLRGNFSLVLIKDKNSNLTIFLYFLLQLGQNLRIWLISVELASTTTV